MKRPLPPILIALCLLVSLRQMAQAQETKPAIQKGKEATAPVAPQVSKKNYKPVLLVPGVSQDSLDAPPKKKRRKAHKHYDPYQEFLLDSIKQAKLQQVLSDTTSVYPDEDGGVLKLLPITPEVNRNFEGNIFNGYGPPDNAMAISDNGWIITAVNSAIGFYNQNGVEFLDMELAEFYSGLNLSNFVFDPRVLYDPIADRFILISLSGNTPSESLLIISFSQSENPNDGWWTYIIDGNFVNVNTWFDYPLVGLSAEDLYISGNLFNSNDIFSQSVIMQLDKEDGYNGDNLSYVYWNNITSNTGASIASIQPVSYGFDGGYGPGVYLVSSNFASGSSIYLLDISADYGNNPQLTTYTAFCPFYSIGSDALQQGSGKLLDVGDCRMQMAFYANGVVHYTHHDEYASGFNGIRYGRLNVSNLSVSAQTFGLNGFSYSYPVIAPLSNSISSGDVLIGFTRSGSNIYPQFRAVTVDASFNFSSSISVKNGDSPIIFNDDNVQRWGDYSGISRRHSATTPAVWIFGCYGKGSDYGNWLAEIVPIGTGTSSCSGNTPLTACPGSFTDGSGSTDYDNNLNCSWTISPPGATAITLTFTEFQTEECCDFVRIYDGANANAPLLGEFSGPNIPSPVTGLSGSLFVQFTTDQSAGFPGWSADYVCATPANDCSQATAIACGDVVSGETGGIPLQVPECGTTLTSAPGNWYTFTGQGTPVRVSTCNPSTDYDTKIGVFSGDCDNLVCVTGDDDDDDCTDFGPSTVEFVAENGIEYYIYVTGFSDNTGNYELSLDCLGACSGNTLLTDCSGTFSDGSNDADYANYLNCSWTIAPPNATAVTLNFTAFETESCCDEVKVYNGEDDTAPLLGEFAGNALPQAVTANSGKMFVLFTTDYSVTRPGWTASYTCTTLQAPAANFIANTTSGAAPLTVQFTDQSTNAPTSWLWNFGNGQTSTQQNPSHTYTEPGVYSVSLTATNTAGQNTFMRTNYITVNSGILPPVAAFNAAVTCGQAPLTVAFTDNSNNNPTSWSWNFGNGQTSTQQNPAITFETPGIYTVQLTSGNTAGSNTAVQNAYITVVAPVEISVTPANQVCAGDAVTLIASGAETYAWSGQGLSANSGTAVSAQPVAPGAYQYQVIGTTNNCNSAPAFISLEVFPSPVISINASSVNTCVGQSVTLTASGAEAYNWTGTGLSGNTGNQVTASASAPGSYTYQVTGAANGCTSAPQSISIAFNPVPTVVALAAVDTICVSQSAVFAASGANTYSWVGEGLSSNSGSTVSAMPSAPGQYTYTVTGTSNGCSAPPQSLTLTVVPIPQIAATASSNPLCLGDTLILTGSGAAQIFWAGPNLLNFSGNTAVAVPAQTGAVTYQATGNGPVCAATPAAVNVEVISNILSAEITVSDCPGPNLTFTAAVINGGNTPNILWYRNGQAVWTGATYTLFGAQNGDEVYCQVNAVNAPPCTSPGEVQSNTITVNCISTSTGEVAGDQLAFDIVPNPNSGDFSIKAQLAGPLNGQLIIFDALGRNIWQQSLQWPAGNQFLDIDLQNAASGVYWLVLQTTDKLYRKSFVVVNR